jgi:CYTH domain-containing protein/predicted ATPase
MYPSSPLIEPVVTIVLTGGPCSGKSSSLAYLTEKLTDYGFMVFVIPETATLISNNGIDRRKMDRPRQVVMYEEAILEMQLSFEETYRQTVARIFPEKRKVILLDRGIMDIKAFVSGGDFKAMLKKRGLTEVAVRDRYNGVIHLVTAAEGARAYYTGENNTARIETPEEAILLDQKIQRCWLGHPRFSLIDNRTDFEGKIKRTFGVIADLLGIPVPPQKKERFLVDVIEYDHLPPHQTIEVEQVFLRSRSPHEEIHIRKRGHDGAYLYLLCRKRTIRGHEPKLTEEGLITEQEYENFMKLMDPKTEVLTKEHICILWENRYCELDRYRGRHEGVSVLEIENPDTDQGQQGPPFLRVIQNITADPGYDDRTMALKKRTSRR